MHQMITWLRLEWTTSIRATTNAFDVTTNREKKKQWKNVKCSAMQLSNKNEMKNVRWRCSMCSNSFGIIATLVIFIYSNCRNWEIMIDVESHETNKYLVSFDCFSRTNIRKYCEEEEKKQHSIATLFKCFALHSHTNWFNSHKCISCVSGLEHNEVARSSC